MPRKHTHRVRERPGYKRELLGARGPGRHPRRAARLLEEVVSRPAAAARDVALVVGHGREDAELCVEVAAHRHDGGDVAAAVAVVGCRPDSDDGLFGEVVLKRG